MYKAVIFDLDGTLLNTSKDICKVLNTTLSHFSLPNISLEQTIRFVGNGAKKLVERAVPQGFADTQKVYEYYSKLFANCDNNLTTLYDGADEALREFKASGIKLALITNKPQDATEGVYNKHLSKYCFDLVLGKSDRFELKPNPSSTLFAAQYLGVNIKDCLFVGDGETDVITAKNAGCDGVAVLWGFRTKEQLSLAGANIFAENYKQLIALVAGTNEK